MNRKYPNDYQVHRCNLALQTLCILLFSSILTLRPLSLFLAFLFSFQTRQIEVEMSIKNVMAHALIQIVQKRLILTHLKLWIAVARHNF